MPENTEVQLRDIRGPQEWGGARWEQYFFPAVFFMIVILGMVVLIKRRRHYAKIKQSIPPDQAALARLQSLNQRKTMDENFYIELAKVVRNFIQDRFKIKAPDLTTEELCRCLNSEPSIDRQYVQPIIEVLQQCDLVKFSRRLPAEEQSRSLINTAQIFIYATNHQG